jgi:hypothetical protein
MATFPARVAELADALALGASAFGRGGSSPPSRTLSDRPAVSSRAYGASHVEQLAPRRANAHPVLRLPEPRPIGAASKKGPARANISGNNRGTAHSRMGQAHSRMGQGEQRSRHALTHKAQVRPNKPPIGGALQTVAAKDSKVYCCLSCKPFRRDSIASANALNALALWLMAFFSEAGISAKVSSWPSGTKTES